MYYLWSGKREPKSKNLSQLMQPVQEGEILNLVDKSILFIGRDDSYSPEERKLDMAFYGLDEISLGTISFPLILCLPISLLTFSSTS